MTSFLYFIDVLYDVIQLSIIPIVNTIIIIHAILYEPEVSNINATNNEPKVKPSWLALFTNPYTSICPQENTKIL